MTPEQRINRITSILSAGVIRLVTEAKKQVLKIFHKKSAFSFCSGFPRHDNGNILVSYAISILNTNVRRCIYGHIRDVDRQGV
jgi:hypothetical protein